MFDPKNLIQSTNISVIPSVGLYCLVNEYVHQRHVLAKYLTALDGCIVHMLRMLYPLRCL